MLHRRPITLSAGLAFLLVGAVLSGRPAVSAAAPVPINTETVDEAQVVPGEVLVEYRAGSPASRVEQLRRLLGARVLERFQRVGLERLRLGAGVSVQKAVQALAADPSVAHAQPNFLYRAAGSPNDPYFGSGSLWALNNYGQSGGTSDADIDAPEAWSLSTGSSAVVVGVIDTGIDYNHPDLAPNIWTNPGEVPGNRVDDDGNGYVDDVHGWNAAANNGNPMDDNGHGTHVAGTIGAVGNNGVGVAGINWSVKIVPLKFLGSDGSGSTASAIACLDYLHKLKDRGVNVIASNNSWGGGGYDQLLRDAIERSNTRGILFVAASGNGDAYGNAINNDSTPQYPASYTNANIISVTATDNTDRRAYFANYGSTSVDLGAPGVDILSTTPNDTYSSYSGTSMATPHVTGAVALLRAYNSSLTALQIRDRILATGDPCADLSGKTVTGRRLNLANALQGTTAPPPVTQEMVVTAKSDRSTYRFGQNAYITVKAVNKANGTPVSGATLSVSVRTPRGYVHTGSAKADATGAVTFVYVPRSTYGSGTYRVSGTASAGGYTNATSTTTSFYAY